MQKETIYTGKAPEPIGPYSQAVKVSWDMQQLIYTSGQVAIDAGSGNFIAGGIKDQTKQVLDNLNEVLVSAKSDLKKVIKTTVFLKNMDDFSAMNEVYAEYFGDSKPARSTVEVTRLPKDALVEIEAVAFL